MNKTNIDLTINDDNKELILINEFNPKDSETELTKKKVKQRQKKPVLNEQFVLNYENFYNNKITISSYKLVALKEAAKLYKLNISGTKPRLIARIENHFKQTSSATIIQRIFRGAIVRMSNFLKGPAFKNRSMCNNDNDFVTMEPLDEIPNEYFYSYTDEKNFTYGFNISSLIKIFKTKGSLMNPYNREKFKPELLNDVIKLYRIIWLINEDFRNENENLTLNVNNRY
jgi:hypothetical protein